MYPGFGISTLSFGSVIAISARCIACCDPVVTIIFSGAALLMQFFLFSFLAISSLKSSLP